MLVVVAAGRGSRMGSLTEDQPKCMLPICDRPMIQWHMAAAHACGMEKLSVVTGYHGEKIDLPGASRYENPEWATTNMVYSLFCAESGFGDDLIVAYGDICYEETVLASLLESDADISVVVDRGWRRYWCDRSENPISDTESLKTDTAGHIVTIGQKISSLDEVEGQYIGLMRFKGAGLDAMKQVWREGLSAAREGRDLYGLNREYNKLYMTDLLMEMIRKGHELKAVDIDRGWLEVDSHQDYEYALKATEIRDGRLVVTR